MVEERSKRALPPRHSFLTDAVCSVLESQSKLQVPQVDSRTVLKLDQDTSHCTVHDEPAPPPLPSSDTRPIFRILPQRRSIKTKSNTAFSDDYYTTRHRKHEMEEKKQKNREKERLEHELYQQQQLVERLKTLDKSTLASIVSSIRHNGPTSSSSSSYTSMSSSDLERLHQTILKDAREQMYRYEQLGLGRKRGQGFATPHHHHSHHQQQQQQQRVLPETTTATIPTPSTIVKSSLLQPHSPPPSPPCSLLPPMKKPPSPPSMASLVLAHFQAHRQPSTGGQRKSLRTAVAFGEKLPAMNEMEFYLPDDLFGEIKHQRTTSKTTKRRRLV